MRRLTAIYLIIFLLVISCLASCKSGKNTPSTNRSDKEKNKESTIQSDSFSNTAANLEELEKRFNSNPTSFTSASDYANALRRDKEFEEAIGVWDKFINNAIGPDLEQAKIERSVLLTEIGKSEEAYNDLLAIAGNEKNQTRGEAYFQLGNLIATGKITPTDGDKIELATGYFEKALDCGQTDPLVYRRLADLMYSAKKLEKAREYLAIFLVVAPNDYSSWLDLANWSVEAKDYSRARAYYERALKSDNREIREQAEKAIRKLPSD